MHIMAQRPILSENKNIVLTKRTKDAYSLGVIAPTVNQKTATSVPSEAIAGTQALANLGTKTIKNLSADYLYYGYTASVSPVTGFRIDPADAVVWNFNSGSNVKIYVVAEAGKTITYAIEDSPLS
jgi:hypothetical protein